MKELTKEILQDSKWRVTPEQSKRLQEKAFELGFYWSNDTIKIAELEMEFLIFDSINFHYDCTEEFFKNNNYHIERKFEDYFEEEKVIDNVELAAEEIYGKILIEGTFMWAVEQKENGKEIKRKNRRGIIKLIHGLTWDNQDGTGSDLTVEDFKATDWEIYEENKFGDCTIEKMDNKIHIQVSNKFWFGEEYFDDLEKSIKRARELE